MKKEWIENEQKYLEISSITDIDDNIEDFVNTISVNLHWLTS